MGKQDGNWGLEGMAGNCQPILMGLLQLKCQAFLSYACFLASIFITILTFLLGGDPQVRGRNNSPYMMSSVHRKGIIAEMQDICRNTLWADQNYTSRLK